MTNAQSHDETQHTDRTRPTIRTDGGVQQTTHEGQASSSDSSRLVAGLLAIFLGIFGAHKFYQGNLKLGIIYLVFFWTTIPGLLGLIEGILMLLADDETYEQKYASGSFMGR